MASRSAAPAPPRAPGFRIGADENGLGPLLGPMVITAVLAKVGGEGWKVASRAPRGKLAERLGDSKGLVAHGDVALGEAWARAIVERCGAAAKSPDALIHAIAADERTHLRAPCPSHVEAQCWADDGEQFASDDDLVATVRADLDALAKKGVELLGVRSVIVCSKRLNEAAAQGKNRFVVDLHAMERLVLAMREQAGGDVVAVCGKVGGFGRYSDVFGPLGGRLHATIEERRTRSAYHFPGVGEIAFVQDADASDLCVGMASMVGKYMREALMARIVRHYKKDDPELPDASGYHDPVTRAFVKATRIVRGRRDVPGTCFERVRVDEAMAQSARGA